MNIVEVLVFWVVLCSMVIRYKCFRELKLVASESSEMFIANHHITQWNKLLFHCCKNLRSCTANIVIIALGDIGTNLNNLLLSDNSTLLLF